MSLTNYKEKVLISNGIEEKVLIIPPCGTKRGGEVLAKLEPYFHLLPDLSTIDLKEQQKLYQALFSVGVSAAISLHKLLNDGPAESEFEKPPSNTVDLQEVNLKQNDFINLLDFRKLILNQFHLKLI